MSKSYLFLKPSSLPLVADALDASSVAPIDADEVLASLKLAFPALAWSTATEASGDTDYGWVEFSQPGDGPTRSLAMRCSLRADYRPLVQGLCDRFGWVAFDETPVLFQPHGAPQPV